MTNRDSFLRRCHFIAMIISALIFGLTHFILIMLGFFVSNRDQSAYSSGYIFGFDLKSLLFLVPLEMIESSVFLMFGYGLSLAPVMFLHDWRNKRGAIGVISYSLLGAFVGLVSLPVCAGVRLLVAHGPEDQSFLLDCFEYVAPMIAAGAAGGYTFWRNVAPKTRKVDSIAAHFS